MSLLAGKHLIQSHCKEIISGKWPSMNFLYRQLGNSILFLGDAGAQTCAS